ncbi:MAG: hypothetical protein WBF53_07690 [Litorimonas sp.]
MKFSDGYELLPVDFGTPERVSYDGISLGIDFRLDVGETEQTAERWCRIVFKPIWFAVGHSSFEDGKRAFLDFDPIDALGLYPAASHAQFKGLDLVGYKFRHFDETIRVITFDKPDVCEITREQRFAKIEKT